MNKLLPILFLLCLFISASSQENAQIELDSLRKQLPPLIRQKKLDNVISIAEKIVEIEKKGGEKNLKNYAKALHDLALWRDYRIFGRNVNSQAEFNKTREMYGELSTLAATAQRTRWNWPQPSKKKHPFLFGPVFFDSIIY
jgi:hypothetical protein